MNKALRTDTMRGMRLGTRMRPTSFRASGLCLLATVLCCRGPFAYCNCTYVRVSGDLRASAEETHWCVQKLYRTLSELKAEVEGAIRSGRQVAERAGPALSARIDALKELYNRLGARVTDAKGRLEGALVASREMHADLQALAGWLDSLAARPPRQTLELEMSRMEGLRDKLNATYAELDRACPGAQLAALRAQVAQVNARWERLRRRSPPSPPPAASPPPTPAHAPDRLLEVSPPLGPSASRTGDSCESLSPRDSPRDFSSLLF